MHVLFRLSKGIASIVEAVGRWASWLALPLMGVILFDVITRRFLVLGSTKLQEMEWHLHAVLFLLCLGFAYIRNAHVRIELVRERLGPRTRHAIELAGALLFLIPYCAVVIHFGIDYAARSYATGEVSASLTGLPYRWIIKSFVVMGFALLGLAGLAAAGRSAAALFGGPVLRAEIDLEDRRANGIRT